MTSASHICKQVLTITLNPAIDRTVELDSFIYGDVNRAVNSREEMGGKGINVARMMSLCGTSTTAAGLQGNDNIKLIAALLAADTFSAKWILVPGKTRTNTKLVTRNDHKTTDLNEPGFNLQQVNNQIMEDLLLQAQSWAEIYDIIVFAGSIPPGLSDDTYARLIKACRKANPEIFIVVDTQGQALLAAIQAGADMIKPNIAELASITNMDTKTLTKETDIIKICQQLISDYSVSTILLSNGKQGALLFSCKTQDKTKIDIISSQALAVNPVSTTGAGDSLLAGFLSAKCDGLADKECLARATACAALAVSRQSWDQLTAEAIAKNSQTALSLISTI